MSAMQIGMQQPSQLKKNSWKYLLRFKEEPQPPAVLTETISQGVSRRARTWEPASLPKPLIFLVTFPFRSHCIQWTISPCGTKGCKSLGTFLPVFRLRMRDLHLSFAHHHRHHHHPHYRAPRQLSRTQGCAIPGHSALRAVMFVPQLTHGGINYSLL